MRMGGQHLNLGLGEGIRKGGSQKCVCVRVCVCVCVCVCACTWCPYVCM